MKNSVFSVTWETLSVEVEVRGGLLQRWGRLLRTYGEGYLRTMKHAEGGCEHSLTTGRL